MYRSPAETPRARLPLLDQITVKTPCREDWNAMVGDERVRFCARCSKNVYDLSAMTADEAETFLATHLDDEAPCVRLYRRPDGRVLTSECMQGARTRHARKVGAGVAAGLCAVAATTLALANVHIPDGRNLPRPRARIDVKRLADANFDDAANAVHAPDDGIRPVEEGWAVVPNELHGGGGWSMGESDGHVMGLGIPRGLRATPERPQRVIRELGGSVEHGLPMDALRRVVRLSFGRFNVCYESGLRTNPVLTGEIEVRFVIGRDGSVIRAKDAGSTLPDRETVACVVRAFNGLTFPAPEGGPISASYGLTLRPQP